MHCSVVVSEGTPAQCGSACLRACVSSAMFCSVPDPFPPRRKKCEVDDSWAKSDSADDHCKNILNNLSCSSTGGMLGVCSSVLERREREDSTVFLLCALVNQTPSEILLLF